MSLPNARDLLTSVHGRLAGLREAQKIYARRLAPEFNTLSLLRPDEIRLSSLLAELFDPAGSHAQGRKFWDLFAEHFELPAWAVDAKQFQIRTEVQTDGADRVERRIDVLVALDGRSAVAIENKPWAADQTGQVSDYLTHLHVRYPGDHVLIYLSGNGRGPEASSIGDEEMKLALAQGRLQLIGFADLLPWLAACRSACEAPSVVAFLGEFENYIRAEFLGVQDMIENDLIVEEATRNPAAIEAAFEIARAANNIKQKLLGDLEAQIRALMKETHTPWMLTVDTDWSAKGQGFSFQLSPNDCYTVRFQFELSDWRQFFFGLTKFPPAAHLDDVREALDSEFNCRSKTSDHWTWYRDFESPLWDWNLTSAPWQRIAEGEMARKIVSIVEQIYRRLDRSQLLSQLGMVAPQADGAA
ncbi:PD-(D/E)XK nuclease family protein [Paraburkholderia fungorum]|uniref:PDDEXK-like family protein n=1 Tax=Paraburkholderia fungorum TaxID=134537 RepID=UPI0038BD70AE